MTILIKVAQLLLSLSILVLIHEFGHFIAAKIFKTRVEKFYLFFDPWFSLFKFKKGETEYGIGWLPLGGYVKISGMIDESMDKEQMKQPPQPWEFRSKPAWQRLIIMVGGVFMNVVLAIAIYIVMLAVWGEQYLPNNEVKYGITVDSLAQSIGLQNGDKIISLDNKPVEDFNKIPAKIILDNPKTIQVERNGVITQVNIPDGFVGKLIKSEKADFIMPRSPFVAAQFSKGSLGEKGGIRQGDVLVSINQIPVPYFDIFSAELSKHKNEKVEVGVLRGKDTVSIPVQLDSTAKLGIYSNPYLSLTTKTHHYNVLEAIPAGFKKTFKGISSYWKQLKLLVSPKTEAYKSVGGFIAIGKIFPSMWNWEAFWSLTAFLSIVLAIMNILPIPALDGGHIMFLLYEVISGRKPSDKFMERAQVVGMIILFALLIFANGNDIWKLFKQ